MNPEIVNRADQPLPSEVVVEMETWKILDEFGKAAKARGWSPITIANYRGRLAFFFKAVGKTRIEEITPADLRKYAELMSDKKDENFNLALAAVKSLFKWAYKNDLAENIGEKIELRRIRERQIEDYVWLTADESDKLLTACKSVKQTLAVKFFLKTGMRVGKFENPRREFCGLSWDDFNFEQRTIRVHGKGRGIEGKIRYAHFDNELGDLLKVWRDTHRGRMPIYKASRSVTTIVRELARKAGAPKLANAQHPVHALKHTFCTGWVLARRKANLPEDLRGLAAQVGTQIKTLEVYVHIAEEFLKSSYDETMGIQSKEVGQ